MIIIIITILMDKDAIISTVYHDRGGSWINEENVYRSTPDEQVH